MNAVISALYPVLAAPAGGAPFAFFAAMTLVQFFGVVDEGSPLARLFALIDLFMVWWIVVLAIGLAVLYQTRMRTILAGLMTAYAGIAVLLAGAMAVLGGNS